MSGFQHDIAGGQGNLIATSVQSPNYAAGSAGWQIKKDGSAEFNNVTVRGTLSGPSMVINTTGLFLYSGTPALGNPPVFYSTTASADPFGNALTPDVARSVSGNAFAQLGGGALLAQDASGDQIQVTGAAIGFLPSGVDLAGTIQTNGTNELDLLAPVTPGGGNQAEIQLISSAASPVIDIGAAGVPSGNTVNLRGTVNLGASGNAQWADGTQQFSLPAGGGPFIAGETFHTVSNGTNFTGTMRAKLLPWNAVWLDVQLVYTTTAAVTANFGSLPSAAYYPTGTRQFPLSCNAAPTAVSSSNRVFVPTSGAVQVIIPQALAAANGQLSLSVIYPTN